MKIEILIADDQLLILEVIKTILEPEPEIEVVGTARDGLSAIALAKKLRPDIVLMDIEMPKMNGISATKYICKYFPNTKIIVLTSHKNQDYIAEALLAGASGYLWKGNLIGDLKQEIYSFGRGYSSVKARLLTNGRSHTPEKTLDDRLTRTVKKNSTSNVVKYREKIIYLKKHRKKIYKPAVKHKQQRCLYLEELSTELVKRYPKRFAWQREVSLGQTQSRQIYNTRASDPDISNASLAFISKLTTKKIIATNLKTSSSSRFYYRKYLRKIIWLLLAISSILLSIVVF